MSRMTLIEPITVKAGEVLSITFKMDMLLDINFTEVQHEAVIIIAPLPDYLIFGPALPRRENGKSVL